MKLLPLKRGSTLSLGENPQPGSAAAPRAAVLLPVVVLVHVAEEWFGGFPAWTQEFLGGGVDSEQFLYVNTIGILLFGLGTLAALSHPSMAWIGVSLATLLGFNGVLHGLASVVSGSYSPGVVTGLLLSVPLAWVVLRSSAPRLSRAVFTAAVLGGVVVHAIATFVAFL